MRIRLKSKTKAKQSKHARYSPSKAKIWLNCADSVKLTADLKQKQLVADVSSEAAQRGTALHLKAENVLANFSRNSEYCFADEEIREYVMTVIYDYQKHDIRKSGQLLIEKKVFLNKISKDLYGTADAVILYPGHAIVYDLKTGAHRVESALTNWQMRIYALGVLYEFEKRFNIKFVTSVIVQNSVADRFTFDIEDMRQFETQLIDSIRYIENEDRKEHYAPNDDTCRFCIAKTHCKAFINYSTRGKHEMTLNKFIDKERKMIPPTIAVYGASGIGKTDFACSFPAPIVIPVEPGLSDLDVERTKQPLDWKTFREILSAVAADKTDTYKTLVIDSITLLENLIWDDLCEKNSWESIETPGYGKGYVETDWYWHELMRACKFFNTNRSKCVILIAHESIAFINDPTTEGYDQFQMRLHKRASAIVRDQSDMIGYMTLDYTTKKKKDETRAKAKTSGRRKMLFASGISYVAKSRIRSVPNEIEIPLGKGFDKLKTHIVRKPAAAKKDK